MTTACPACGVPDGGRYRHNGRLVCWPCTGLKPLKPRRPTDPDWVRFRKRVCQALERDGVFHYINEDRAAGRCPVCSSVLVVCFKGRRPAADFICYGGCSEREVAAMLGKASR